MIIANKKNTKFLALADLPRGISHPYASPNPYHFNSAFAARVAIEKYVAFNATDTETYEVKDGWMVLDDSGAYQTIYYFDNKFDAERKKEEWDAEIDEARWDAADDDDWDYMIRVKPM